MGKVTNQYSEIFRKLEIETGKDIFLEYHDPSATEERKQEIEKQVFDIMRSVNELPKLDFDEANVIRSLTRLSNVQIADIYDPQKKEFALDPVGVDVLYQFFPNIWDVRKANCPLSVREGFYNDKKLRAAIHKTLKYKGTEMDIIRWLRMLGLGYCVNFRPAVAKTLYEMEAPANARVYDFAGGYGARCLGAHFAENVVEYVGVDVNTETVQHTHEEQAFLAKHFDTGTKETTYLCGSEEFLQKHPEYKGYFDLSFSSPQYFNTEIYSLEETQSCHKYPDYVRWVKYFYIPTILNAIDVLKPGGVFAINIFEKLKNLKGDQNLKAITKKIAAARGFYCYRSDKMLLRVMPGGAGTDEEGHVVARSREIGSNYEPIWFFKHYKTLWADGHLSEEQYQQFKREDEEGVHKEGIC